MASGKFIAYYRVSTDRQGRSGLGLEAQKKAVMDYLNGGSWELIEEFTEVESGKRADRPELKAALAACKKHGAKLIIAKLDRLSRSVAFISTLMESGADFLAADMPEANKLTVHILAAVAQHEREVIGQRTKAALAAAKARGKTLGNRKNLHEARAHSLAVRTSAADQHAENVYPIIQQIKSSGITTLRGVADALNARGIKTARGGKWEQKAVSRIIKRVEPA